MGVCLLISIPKTDRTVSSSRVGVACANGESGTSRQVRRLAEVKDQKVRHVQALFLSPVLPQEIKHVHGWENVGGKLRQKW